MKDAARTEFQFDVQHLEPLRSPPFRQMLGLGINLPENITPRIEETGDDKLRTPGDQGEEAVEALAPTGLVSGDRQRKFGLRLGEMRFQLHCRLAVPLGECHGVHRFDAGVALFIEKCAGGKDELLQFDDDDEFALHRHGRRIGSLHMNEDGATGPDIHFADRVAVHVRAPPFCHLLWLGPGFPNHLAWHIEDALDDEFF